MLLNRPSAVHHHQHHHPQQAQQQDHFGFPATTTTHQHHTAPAFASPSAAIDSLPPELDTSSAAFAIPRSLQGPSREDGLSNSSQPPDLMPSENWALASQYTPKTLGRMSHQRESSLSSLGSAGPASPFNPSTSNPQIALSDPANDGFGDMQAQDAGSSYYQLAKVITASDAMYPGYHNLGNLDHPDMGYPSAISMQRPRSDKDALLPTPDFSTGQGRSHPPSVASSTVGGDSPATPSLGEPVVTINANDEDKRRKAVAITEPPKLDRTMTDIYGDELYNPSFSITSASPARNIMELSPGNDIFAQRLNAANSQHLTTTGQSPTSSISRDRSPFCNGSPHAPATMQLDAGKTMSSSPSSSSPLRFNSAQKLREQGKVDQEAQVFQQQIATKAEPETPKTISPKDAMLEFSGADADPNFPSLFPSQESSNFDGIEGVPKLAAAGEDQFGGLFPRPMSNSGSQLSAATLPYMPQVPAGVHVPQQYPFIAHPRQQHQASPPQLCSSNSSMSSSATPVNLQKPGGVCADGGTYTCTYHGCTLRFETPALLQKHKREGHRQPQGLGAPGPRRADVVAAPVTNGNTLLNSQAGPHRCDRINPSTGKPCCTIFSRPYDLTRHEDTIHNARKQKVRCNLCTEEKTFSRADALTRHYRVCHPDVEFPGKYRRRGQNS